MSSTPLTSIQSDKWLIQAKFKSPSGQCLDRVISECPYDGPEETDSEVKIASNNALKSSEVGYVLLEGTGDISSDPRLCAVSRLHEEAGGART